MIFETDLLLGNNFETNVVCLIGNSFCCTVRTVKVALSKTVLTNCRDAVRFSNFGLTPLSGDRRGCRPPLLKTKVFKSGWASM